MTFVPEPFDMSSQADHLICTACGTQFPSSNASLLRTCFICDDPRQFVPPAGQGFTTHDALSREHHNVFTPYEADRRFISITTVPKFAIGQRAIMLRTSAGNILWDCITLLDPETIARITALGGIQAIVISHPHYYTTHVQWARAFRCPVYLAAEDMSWVTTTSTHQIPLTSTETRIMRHDSAAKLSTKTGTSATEPIATSGATANLPPALAIKLGGHFPGSLVLLYDNHLFIADTLVTTPSGLGNWSIDAMGAPRTSRPAGLNSFAFMWSIPNQIPLGVDEVARMWAVLKRYHFRATHGAFLGTEIEDAGVKKKVLQSMQIQARYMGYTGHGIMAETVNERRDGDHNAV